MFGKMRMDFTKDRNGCHKFPSFLKESLNQFASLGPLWVARVAVGNPKGSVEENGRGHFRA
jgi:hypothetical protein